MKQKNTAFKGYLLLSLAVIMVLAVIIVYFALNSYYNIKITTLQTTLNKSNSNYNHVENLLLHPYTAQVYSNKNIILHSLLYPSYISGGFNTSYVSYFIPTETYIYYNFSNGTYIPLPLVNSSYSSYNFNITENAKGYLVLNYTSNSSSGISLSSSDCLANFFTLHTLSEYSVGDANNNGSITIPTQHGQTCFYISNPSNSTIHVTFSATFVSYPSS